MLRTVPPHLVVRAVAEGQNLVTEGIILLYGSTDEGEMAILKRLVDAGLVATVLQLLERCEDETFTDVLSRHCGGGDLEAPSRWLLLLLQAAAADNRSSNDEPVQDHSNSRMEIARRIGPLVRCMTNDSQRLFFGENKYWWRDRPIVYFVALVEGLVRSLETVPILLQYEGLTEFLIQCLFWERCRSDIVEESRKHAVEFDADNFKTIRNGAIRALRALFRVKKIMVDGCFVRFSDEGSKRLHMIASTKIVSAKYNPDCKVTFAAGWFDLMNEGPSDDERRCLWFMLQQLTWNQSVNKALIVRMVQCGMTNVKSPMDALDMVNALHDALIPIVVVDGRALGRRPSEDRYYVAIKTGLIEMCLTLIVRFGSGNENDLHRDTMLETLGVVLIGASAVALYNKLAKAVTERRSSIQEALRSTVGITEGKSFELVEKVRSIVSINMETEKKTEWAGFQRVLCHSCHQVLQSGQIKMCSKCHQGTT